MQSRFAHLCLHLFFSAFFLDHDAHELVLCAFQCVFCLWRFLEDEFVGLDLLLLEGLWRRWLYFGLRLEDVGIVGRLDADIIACRFFLLWLIEVYFQLRRL